MLFPIIVLPPFGHRIGFRSPRDRYDTCSLTDSNTRYDTQTTREAFTVEAAISARLPSDRSPAVAASLHPHVPLVQAVFAQVGLRDQEPGFKAARHSVRIRGTPAKPAVQKCGNKSGEVDEDSTESASAVRAPGTSSDGRTQAQV